MDFVGPPPHPGSAGPLSLLRGWPAHEKFLGSWTLPLLGYPGDWSSRTAPEGGGQALHYTPGAAPSPNLFVAVIMATKVSDALYFLGIQDGGGATSLPGVLPI